MKEMLLKIERQGCIVVNGGWVIAKGRNLVAIEIDLKSKYAEISGISGAGIMLGATKETLHKDESKGDEFTFVSFPAFPGYTVHSTDLGRYTLRLCLLDMDAIQLKHNKANEKFHADRLAKEKKKAKKKKK